MFFQKTSLFLFVCSFVALFIQCAGDDSGFTIAGEIEGCEDKWVYRVVADANNQPQRLDSAQVKNGAFKLQGTVDQIDINFLLIEGVNGNYPVIIEPGTIKATLYKDSLGVSKVVGTPSNTDLSTYRQETVEFMEAVNSISAEMQKAALSKDSLLVADLREQYTDIQKQVRDYEMGILKEKTSSYLSALLLERFVNSKIVNAQEAKTYIAAFEPAIQNSKAAQNISTKIANIKQPVGMEGNLAPDFSGPTPTGETLSLKSKMGKVTIVEFWASWCRPCRVENPNLVRTYNKYHDKGLEIVAVSLDKNKASWEKAIADDGLIWNHVSNLKYWQDPIAKLYGVRAIPASFVLDAEGRIVAKGLRGAALDQKIGELLQ